MTHRKNKTLSDSISFLLSESTGKLVNPDEDINTESQARVVDWDGSDDELLEIDVAPSKLRQKNVEFLDSLDRKYRGGVTSRKDLKDSDSDFDNDDSIRRDSGDDEDASEEQDGHDLGDSENDAIADIRKKGSESFVSFTDFSVDDNQNEESESEDEGEDTEGGSEGENDRENYSNAGSEMGGIQHFSTKDAKLEVKKGQAVRNQLAVWDTLMECRIQLQKVITQSNQLPESNVLPMFRSQGGSGFTSTLAKAENSLIKLLQSLLNLQEKLLKQYPETKDLSKTTATLKESVDDGMDEEISSSEDEKEDNALMKSEEANRSDFEDEEDSDEEANEGDGNEEDDEERGGEDNNKFKSGKESAVAHPAKKRKLNDYSNLLSKHHLEFTPYRNNTIQKWNTRTQVAVGRAGSKNFSGFEQSTLQQIEHILADKLRLIRRTQLRRADYKILGQVKKDDDKTPSENIEGQADTGVPMKEERKTAAGSGKEYDPEIFDDSDFYHQLLRELIEKKTADVTDPVQLGRQWIQLQKMRSKMKRKVDVKASKGRRLRYSVHPKLVNFMAPQTEFGWSENAKNDLYASLFGQRKS